MRLEINTKLIDCGPLNKELEMIFSESNSETREQLESDIINGNTKNYLVSGYRGAGKTSLIKKIEDNNKDKENIVFVHLNISRLEEHNYLLRKLIRELYLAIKNNNTKENDEIKKLQDLYNKTFFKIERYSKYEKVLESETEAQIDFNYKKFISVVVGVVISGLNLKLNFIGKNLNTFIFIGLSIFLCIDVAKIVRKFRELSIQKKGIDSSELFDDEISEYRLNEVLIELKKELKVIFVLDELDKIDDLENVEKILNNLKPLMLGGLASFIVIPGQKLIYKLSNDDTIDNSYLSDIFSKKIHVSFLEDNYFHDIFKKLIITDDSNINESNKIEDVELMNNFIDYLILKSNSIPRKFFNNISNYVIWEKEKSYLMIEENNMEIYKSSSNLLSVLGKFYLQIENATYKLEEIDFIKVQINIWINRMKKKGMQTFKRSEIFNLSEEYNEKYHIYMKKVLDGLLTELLNELSSENIVKVENDEISWNNNIVFEQESGIFNEDRTINDFLMRTIEIEQKLRRIYGILFGRIEHNRLSSLRYLIEELNAKGVLNSAFANFNWINLSRLKSKGTHERYTEEDKEEILLIMRTLGQVEYYIYEDFYYYVINKYLSERLYKVSRISHMDTIGDIYAENENQKIVIEIKYRRNFVGNVIAESQRFLEKIKIENGQNVKLVIFWLLKDSKYKRKQIDIEELGDIYPLLFYGIDEHFDIGNIINNLERIMAENPSL